MAGTVSFNDISSVPHAYSVSDRSVRGVNYEIYCTVILEQELPRSIDPQSEIGETYTGHSDAPRG